jgi:hypothetical protein
MKNRFYTQTPLHTQKLLHREAFIQSRFYTQTPLHTAPFSKRTFYTDAFLHGSIYTETPLHTEAFTQSSVYTHTQAFTHRRFYARMHLHTDTFTQRFELFNFDRANSACMVIITVEQCAQWQRRTQALFSPKREAHPWAGDCAKKALAFAQA